MRPSGADAPVLPWPRMRPRRTVVLADLHLTRHTPSATVEALERFLTDHAGARIVFDGDLFDLSVESPQRREESLDEALLAHPPVRSALAGHVDRGGELWLVAGNHDAEIGGSGFRASLLSALRLSGDASSRVRTTPWFFREGGLHVEHGHLYDPDNAPAHPLVVGAPSLGVHFVQEFLAPTGAFSYLNRNDDTPLALLLSAFRWYGARAPHVVYRYFYAALTAMLRSGPLYRAGAEARTGDGRMDRFAEEAGVPRTLADEVLGQRATPTLESLPRTFSRLYFDRVLATVTMGAGFGGLALGRRAFGATVASLGALLMAVSWAHGHDRYTGTVAERLARAAARISAASGASLVVFGHTHREALDGAYANTGSFSFPASSPGRPFLEIEGSGDRPRAVRRYH